MTINEKINQLLKERFDQIRQKQMKYEEEIKARAMQSRERREYLIKEAQKCIEILEKVAKRSEIVNYSKEFGPVKLVRLCNNHWFFAEFGEIFNCSDYDASFREGSRYMLSKNNDRQASWGYGGITEDDLKRLASLDEETALLAVYYNLGEVGGLKTELSLEQKRKIKPYL